MSVWAWLALIVVVGSCSCGATPPKPQSATLMRVDGGFMICTDFVSGGDAGAE